MCPTDPPFAYASNKHGLQVAAIINVISQVGALVGVTIAGTIFINKIHQGVPKYAPDLSPDLTEVVIQTVSAIAKVPKESQAGVLRAYREALGMGSLAAYQ